MSKNINMPFYIVLCTDSVSYLAQICTDCIVIRCHSFNALRKQLNVNFGLEAFSICNLGAVNGLGMLPQLWVLLLDFV